MLCADTGKMPLFHVSKSSKKAVCIASLHALPYPDYREGLRTGRYHEIVHAGVAFTLPHEYSPERHFHGKAPECGTFRCIWLATPRGFHQHVGLGGQKALEQNIHTSPHPGPRWALRPGVRGIIGWPGATILLLTACSPDAILVPTASWPENMVRGAKRKQREVQPCPGLR